MKNKKLITYCCIDCDNKICKRTALYGKGRCKICANLSELNPNYNNRKYGSDNSTWKGGKPKCLLCDKQLTDYRSRYCIKCFSKTRKNKSRKGSKRFGKNAPSYKDGRSITPNYCIGCNKEISWRSERCRECFGITRTGKNNTNYKHGNGYKLYPLEFNNKLKEEIRIRDDFTCQCCDLREENHIINYKQIALSVHHIDYNKENCKKNNLITLCLKCNLKANYNRDYWFAYYTYVMEN